MRNTDEKRVFDAFSTNKAYYERIEKWHTSHNGVALEPEVKKMISDNCEGNILDAGCGEGSITTYWAQNFPEAKFYGTDVSFAGVSMARSRNTNVYFALGDLCKLPFKSSSFDLIYSQSVLEHVPHYENSLQEFYRVLKNKGKLIIRVGNGGRENRSMLQSFLAYIFHRNKVCLLSPTFVLENAEMKTEDLDVSLIPKDHNFDLNVIPSDVLLKQLKNLGFKIQYFTTRRKLITKGTEKYSRMNIMKRYMYNILMRLQFFPFTHMGPTIIVMVSK